MAGTMQRARRSARAVIHGGEILEFVEEPKTRRLLVAAAETGAPPVTAISSALKGLVGTADARLTPVKQFTGLCVRAVLEEEGFELVQTGVRLSNDPVFRTASVFKRKSAPEKIDATDLLERFIASLNDAEVRKALKLLKNRR